MIFGSQNLIDFFGEEKGGRWAYVRLGPENRQP